MFKWKPHPQLIPHMQVKDLLDSKTTSDKNEMANTFVEHTKRWLKRSWEGNYQSCKLVGGENMEWGDIDNDIDACMEKLENMEWGDSNLKYQTTLLLFGESVDIRKVWLLSRRVVSYGWEMSKGSLDYLRDFWLNFRWFFYDFRFTFR